MQRLTATSLSLLLLLPALARAQTQVEPAPKVLGVDVTFLANSGFFLESGRYSVLIDAFLRDYSDIYAGLPDEVFQQLCNARPPFDGLALALVSHTHSDHLQVRGLEKYLTKNRQAHLASSPEVLNALRTGAKAFDPLQRQLTVLQTTPGSMTQVVQEEMSITIFELEHGGKANDDVKNLAHLVELGGVRLLHLGDAEPSLENFARYDLLARKVDVAFVPYWYFGKPVGVQILRERIQARFLVACHVPPSEWQELSELLKANFPEVVLFKEPLEKRTFLPAEAAEAPPEKPSGG
jgi:L-ascorbate metabolism protein UlaG (beta-lactamase superfamily)